MKVTAIIIFLYALVVLSGGITGYAKAASSASLIAGVGFGSALALTAFFVMRGKKAAQQLALLLLFVLDSFFTFRFAKTFHFFPAGLMSLLSLIVLIVLAFRIKKSALKRF